MTRKLIRILVVLGIMVWMVGVAASPWQSAEPISLVNLLVWLTTGGAVIVVSWLFETFGWFQSMAATGKRLLMFLASAVFGLGALAILQFVPSPILAAMAPYFAVVSTVFYSIFLNQLAHSWDPNRLQ